jgi:U3 small nucleolar RNA-associated protein 12
LYGHSQPVLCLDISSDSRLVITGSSDRNIKIWGLDFGDCHRSLFAHDDTITAIQFVSKTHLFFSASKDNKLKYWDADKFLHIQTLDVRDFSRKEISSKEIYLGSLWRDSLYVNNE